MFVLHILLWNDILSTMGRFARHFNPHGVIIIIIINTGKMEIKVKM